MSNLARLANTLNSSSTSKSSSTPNSSATSKSSVMPNLPDFHPGQSATQAHKSILLALKIKGAAHQCSLDWFGEIYDRKLYKELGFSSINRYAKLELGFGESKIGDYLRLTRKLKKLPVLKETISSGKLGYTFGRLISDIADAKTEKKWVDFALENPRKAVEKEVKRAKQEAREKAIGQPSLLPLPVKKTPAAVVPVRVQLEMSPTQFARYESMLEQLRKSRNLPSEKAEAILEIMVSLLDSDSHNSTSREVVSSAKAPAQIHIHVCPECESAQVQTSKGALEIGKNDLERYQCDCQVQEPGKRNTASIPPSIRRSVLSAAHHKCQMPGCNHTRFLEVHHIVPRAKGGTNDSANLQVLCSGCHALIHRKGAGFLVKEAEGSYVWKDAGGFTSGRTKSIAGRAKNIAGRTKTIAGRAKIMWQAESHPMHYPISIKIIPTSMSIFRQ